MLKRLSYIFFALIAALSVFSCSSDEDNTINGDNGNDSWLRTDSVDNAILMFFPYSGPDRSELTNAFWVNIRDMKTAYDTYGRSNERVVVYICTSATEAEMFYLDDFAVKNDSVYLSHHTQCSYLQNITAEQLASVIGDMKNMARARNYSMTVGCHGCGWLNKSTYYNRFFGGNSYDYAIDISTFREALERSDTHLNFLLFDDCYMASVEAIYELRHVTDHVIACPSEMAGEGMSYDTMGQYLLGTPNYEAVCQDFLAQIKNTYWESGTISVTTCNELDSLANVAKKINLTVGKDDYALQQIVQKYDAQRPTVFFDYGDYVNKYCTDSLLLHEFNEQLSRTVPYKAATESFPATYSGDVGLYPLKSFSGLNTSEPSDNICTIDVEETLWYKACH